MRIFITLGATVFVSPHGKYPLLPLNKNLIPINCCTTVERNIHQALDTTGPYLSGTPKQDTILIARLHGRPCMSYSYLSV